MCDFVKSVFPVFCNKYWFATSYIMLLFVAKPIDVLFGTLSQREVKSFLIIMTIFLYILPTVFVFEIFNDSGKGFMNMALVYTIGRYFKKYGFPQVVQRKYKLIFTILLGTIILFSEILFYLGLEKYMIFMRDCSILILCLSIVIFYSFSPLNVKPYTNKYINELAKMIFPVYIIHFGLMSKVCNITNGVTDIFIGDFILSIFALFLASVLVEAIRKLICGKLFDKYVNMLGSSLSKNFPL